MDYLSLNQLENTLILCGHSDSCIHTDVEYL